MGLQAVFSGEVAKGAAEAGRIPAVDRRRRVRLRLRPGRGRQPARTAREAGWRANSVADCPDQRAAPPAVREFVRRTREVRGVAA